LIGKPTDTTTGVAGDARFEPGAPALGAAGQNSETPHVQAKLAYEQDLWGKAAFYGRPRGFAAQVVAAWQRTRYQSGADAANFATFSQNAFSNAINIRQRDQQYLDPWVIQAHLFIPVLPTYSANLAGTASLQAQWYIGQGLDFIGNGRAQDNSSLVFQGIGAGAQFLYDRQLTNQFGGYVQGQYYFTNQWFMNLAWGMSRNFGIDRSISGVLAGKQANNVVGYKYASNNDQVKLWNELDLTLWYRPIEAIKFGLQYSYSRTDWLQKQNNPNGVITNAGQNAQFGQGAKDFGEAHRVEFVGFMFF
jgi:hypothetical protein